YIDGIFEYVKLENGTTYQKNYVHIMDDKSRIAEIRVGTAFPGDIADAITYVLADQIGSSSVRLSTTGIVIDKEEYYPFGDSSLRTFTSKRYRYVGKEKDQESGLYYYGARYYAAWTCRFISVDPLAEKFAQLSPFNYSENNPINDKDIDGMQKGDSKQSAQGGNSGTSGGGVNTSSTNTGAGTNATNANKLPGFTPSTGTPYKSGDLKAAGTDGGGGATKLQNLKVGPTSNEKPVVGHQYPKGTFEGKAADPTPRAAANNNTTGLAGDASNPAPTDTQLLERAFEMLQSSPEIQIGKGALSGSTSGEVTAGIQKNNPNLSGNLFTGEMNKVGAGGVMVSNESLEYGPYSVSNSINTTSETNIQHDAALTPTAIVETSFILQDRTAQFFAGINENKATVVESKTLIPSGQVIPPRTVGEVKQKFATAGFNLFGFQVQIKAPRN
ncbi:MAG: RHS repeat-associated core domain-containing protein, partial [Bacteroidota bacterium]|nr:RHS repeat-associated core domain-containing protein [Bacteroidota bacterium]MDP3557029.1 RHS repeat-associated core domain-containing protein [Bacteroidota bacterium]